MDRRSWLWRRKSSEKSPGETESSGSISSHSERFSDDQAYAAVNPQSPEITSKAVRTAEEVNDNVKTLTDKLSAALLNITAKENLVKQHAKVAEEAVSGWEKAEKELLIAKQQLEAATKKNCELEDRVGHLDAALKECVRQLRQAREDQEQTVKLALSTKIREWESAKSELESQLVELQSRLQTAELKAAESADSIVRQKLEAAEKEKESLKNQLLSRLEELEIRIMERDFSAQAAETASKQHLESIRKVAKLEAECRRLKAVARKASPANDHKALTFSSIYVESFTDSQSDSGERLLAVETDTRKLTVLGMNDRDPSCSDSLTCAEQVKNQKAPGRNPMAPSVEIDLMDDFLEMERLAALPETESECSWLNSGTAPDNANSGENLWKTEQESMIQRTAELEEKLEMIEEEKVNLEMALAECRRELETLQHELREADENLVELQEQLTLANELTKSKEEEVKDIKAMRDVAEMQLKICEAEIKTLLSKVVSLEEQVEKESLQSAESEVKYRKLEEELSNMKHEAELQREAELKLVAKFDEELKIKQEKELAAAAGKFAECQRTISSLGRQLKSLATLDDFLLDSDFSAEGLHHPLKGGEEWTLNSGDTYSGGRDSETFGLDK